MSENPTGAAGAWSYRPGSWFAIFGDEVTIVLPSSERDRVVALWALVDGGEGFDQVLDGLLASGLSSIPGFVLASTDGGPTRLLLRGRGVTATLRSGDEEVLVDGGASHTWVERTVEGVTALTIHLPEDAAAADAAVADSGVGDLPIVTGLVRVGRVDRPAVPAGPAVSVPAASGATAPADEPGDTPADVVAGEPGWAGAPVAPAGRPVGLPTGAAVAVPVGASAAEPALEPSLESAAQPALESSGEPVGAHLGEPATELIEVPAAAPDQEAAASSPEEWDPFADRSAPVAEPATTEWAEEPVVDQPSAAEPAGSWAEEPVPPAEAVAPSVVDPVAADPVMLDPDPLGLDDPTPSPTPGTAATPSGPAPSEPAPDDWGTPWDAPVPVPPAESPAESPSAVGGPEAAPAAWAPPPPPAPPVGGPPPLPIGSWEPLGGNYPPPPPPPAADAPDHDGLTVVGPGDPPPAVPGIPGQPQPPAVTAPVATLHVSDGQTVVVDRTVLIGRAPEARRFTSAEQPMLVTVPSRLHEISSTHIEVRPGSGADHGTAVVTDMGSTNGTVLVQPGLGPEDLKPGIAVQLIPGAVINLGDGITIQVTRP